MFDWDDANVDHIARHGVTPEEAEEALADPGRRLYPGISGSEDRKVVVGRADSGKLLAVVWTRRAGMIRVVTARGANKWEQQAYRRKARK